MTQQEMLRRELERCRSEMSEVRLKISQEEQASARARSAKRRLEDAQADFRSQQNRRIDRVAAIRGVPGLEKLTLESARLFSDVVDGSMASGVRSALDEAFCGTERELTRSSSALNNLEERHRALEARCRQIQDQLAQLAASAQGGGS